METAAPARSNQVVSVNPKQLWKLYGMGPVFSTVVQALRESKGWTRRGLEQRSSAAYSQLRVLESGDRWPSDRLLESVSDALCGDLSVLGAERDALVHSAPDASDLPVHGSVPAAAQSQWNVAATDWIRRFGERMKFDAKVLADVHGENGNPPTRVTWIRADRVICTFEVSNLGGHMQIRHNTSLGPSTPTESEAEVARLLRTFYLEPKSTSLEASPEQWERQASLFREIFERSQADSSSPDRFANWLRHFTGPSSSSQAEVSEAGSTGSAAAPDVKAGLLNLINLLSEQQLVILSAYAEGLLAGGRARG